MQATVQEKHLQNFYPPNDRRIDDYAGRASTKVDQICEKFRVHREIGQDLIKLALFDIVLYIGTYICDSYQVFDTDESR